MVLNRLVSVFFLQAKCTITLNTAVSKNGELTLERMGRLFPSTN